MVTIHAIDTVISDSEIHNGEPVIAGTRIRVTDIVASHLYRGLSPDELAVNYDLNPGQIYAALAHSYQKNRISMSNFAKKES